MPRVWKKTHLGKTEKDRYNARCENTNAPTKSWLNAGVYGPLFNLSGEKICV